MYRKIIVPLDGSELAEQVLPHLPKLQLAEKTEILLVTNIDSNNYAWASQGYTAIHEFWDLIYKSAEEYLRKQQTKLVEQGYQVKYEIVKGQTAASIVDLASEASAELIAMTTHGRTGVARWALGSVADRVIRSTHVPVFLVRAEATPTDAQAQFKRILVPLDGSALAEQAVPQAEAIAQETGAQILLLQVISSLSEMEMDELFAEEANMSTENDRVEAAELYLAQARKRLSLAGLAADTHIVTGRPAEAILDTANALDADLVVMSTHGRSGYKRVLYGSVAGEVLHGSQCPLIVVRGLQPEKVHDVSSATNTTTFSALI
jgi:nucleotide-binding universal stress UspA family protein